MKTNFFKCVEYLKFSEHSKLLVVERNPDVWSKSYQSKAMLPNPEEMNVNQ